MSLHFSRVRLSLVFVAALLATACADTRPESLVLAAEGGTVAVGATEIVIPAGSLVADTTVSIEVGGAGELPALEGLRTVVRLTPEGTALETPASVLVGGDTIGASDGQVVGAWQIVDGAWAPREHSIDEVTGDVTVPVTFFSPIGITVRDAAAGGTIAGTLSWGTGEAVGSAPVQLFRGDAMVAETTTDAAGAFSFGGLESGTYRIVVDYECMIDQAVGVASGATETVTLTLCG